MANTAVEVRHNEAANRFEADLNGQLAVAAYHLAPGRIIFTHTEVPRASQGRGIASQLARTALDYAREQQLIVVPHCSFFITYLRRHPEYQDLLQARAN